MLRRRKRGNQVRIASMLRVENKCRNSKVEKHKRSRFGKSELLCLREEEGEKRKEEREKREEGGGFLTSFTRSVD